MRTRTEEINVRVYKTEKNTIRRKAKKCGMNMSEYLRTLGTGTAVKEAPRRELMLAYQKISRHLAYELIGDGYIPGMKIGNAYRIPKINVIRYALSAGNPQPAA